MQIGLSIDAVATDAMHLRSSLTGWDVGEAARYTLGDVPVIYTSGSSVEQARPVAGSLFFDKPYEPADILRAVGRSATGRGPQHGAAIWPS